MSIDWFTVVAETLNFLILAWLLGRFLYKPVLRAVGQREERIAQELADADEKERHAEAARTEYEQKKLELNQQRASLIKAATGQAAQMKQEMLAQARSDAKEQIERYHIALAQDHDKFSRELIQRTQHEVLAISAKVLTDLADEELHSAILRSFIRQLSAGEGDDQSAFPDLEEFAGKPLLIRSGAELKAEDKQQLLVILQKLFAKEPAVSYETDPKLIGGMEIVSEGHKISWSIAAYLESLHANLQSLMLDFAPESAIPAEAK